MNKKELDELMRQVDQTKKPKHWQKFINKHTKSHNILLQYGKRCYCTHCGKYSDTDSNQVNYKLKKCDFCGNTYNIVNNNKKNYTRLIDVAFYVKVDNQIILRIFEIESKYDAKTRKFKHHSQEYGRFIPNVGMVINNSLSFAMWNMKVYHNRKIKKWHIYTGKRTLNDMPIYPHNKNKLFKNTVYEYAPIKEFKKEYPYYNDFEVFQFASYASFELLWKMGLKKLSLYAKFFNKKGCFAKRFGVSKSFKNFMIQNNIDYEEYKLLKLLQEPNMELINNYKMYDFNYLVFMKKQGYLRNKEILDKYRFEFKTLKNICRFMSLRKFLAYEKGVKNIAIYNDYLEILEKLGYKMRSKDELFPKQLKTTHDKLMKKLKIVEDINSKFGIYIRYLELSKYTYDDGKYIIFPAPSLEEMKEEGKQQENCVGYRYVEPYKNKETEIYFVREKSNMSKSLITLEFNNGRVRQKELAHHNTNFSKEQKKFIEKWVQYRNFMDQKEKYKTKVVKYDLKQLVA